MSFSGLPVSGREAERIGLANLCVPDGGLDTTARAMAAAIATQSRHSVLAYKRLYREQADLPLAAGLAARCSTASAWARTWPSGCADSASPDCLVFATLMSPGERNH